MKRYLLATHDPKGHLVKDISIPEEMASEALSRVLSSLDYRHSVSIMRIIRDFARTYEHSPGHIVPEYTDDWELALAFSKIVAEIPRHLDNLVVLGIAEEYQDPPCVCECGEDGHSTKHDEECIHYTAF